MLSYKTDDIARTADRPPADPGRALSTISGAILRIFSRVNDQEQRIAGLAERLRTIERERTAGRNDIAIEPRSPGRPRV